MAYLLKNRWWQVLVVLFICHQILEKGLSIHLPFVDHYLDDLLCMPIILGGFLAEQMDLTGRQRLSLGQIGLCTVLVAILFEGLLPQLSVRYTADIYDVGCYVLGSLFFLLQTSGRNLAISV